MFELNEKDRLRLSNYIEKNYGIQMPPAKKILLQTRLQKRALQLRYDSLHSYIEYFFSPQGQQLELDQFATIVSTHKTEFFRESDHFETLKTILLPELVSAQKLGSQETLVIWSAASSTGEEVYSIAMTLYDFFKKKGNPLPVIKVIGTDISENIVTFARRAIYNDNAVTTIPAEYHHYLMHSKDSKRKAIRIAPEIRKYTDFRPQNLIDTQYKVKKGIHIIFCRNVLIYFNKSTQEQILRRLVNLLTIGGFLLIGHSESLSGLDLPLVQLKSTVYKKIGEC
ncbi:MAG TPA: CheR family methyltransferase [Chitinispirillaceae bacterium]|nr:CheR family methyltransferase [Chitinispirillaceae bacterium]